MSAFVSLSSKLPGDVETNGVDHIADQLIKDPARIRYAIVWFDVAKTTEVTDTGEIVPTMRVRRIEPLGHADAVQPVIAEIVEEAVRARTGRAPIPFGIVEPTDDDPDQLRLIEQT